MLVGGGGGLKTIGERGVMRLGGLRTGDWGLMDE